MKKVKSLCALTLALFLLLSFSACGNDTPAAGNGNSSPTAGGSTDSMPETGSSQAGPESPQAAKTSDVTMEIKICTVSGNNVQGVGLTESYGEAYDFSCAPEQLKGADALLPGMVVKVGFDGTVLETWPAQIRAETVTVKDQQPDYYSLYLHILKDIYGEDPGLNDAEHYFGFDFTGIEKLSEEEKMLLAWNFSSEYGVEPLHGTLQELMDQGYIDEEGLYWEDGLHFKIEEKECKDNTVSYSVQKWKSGLGAVGYENTASLDKNGKWIFSEISSMWIS